MPDQPTAAEGFMPDIEEVAQAILVVLLDRHPALMSVEELLRYAAYPAEHAFTRQDIEDGVNDLARYGLAHRLDQFAFASYAAKRGEQLHP